MLIPEKTNFSNKDLSGYNSVFRQTSSVSTVNHKIFDDFGSNSKDNNKFGFRKEKCIT